MDIYMERFADFMAKMIEKYADEMEEVIETLENEELEEKKK